MRARDMEELVRGDVISVRSGPQITVLYVEARKAASLIENIIRVWKRQLKEQEEQREEHVAHAERQQQGRSAPAREKKAKDPNCPACQGKHRAHTCK